MRETAQASAERKEVRALGAHLRLGGLFFTAAAGVHALQNIPGTKAETMVSAGLITLGVHIMGRMARDCLMSANYARHPKHTARTSLKYPPILSNMFVFVIASSGLTSLSDSVTQAAEAQAIESSSPMADAKQMVIERRYDAHCAKGKSVITFDKGANSAIIVECTGP